MEYLINSSKTPYIMFFILTTVIKLYDLIPFNIEQKQNINNFINQAQAYQLLNSL